jgi:hypothetical protein
VIPAPRCHPADVYGDPKRPGRYSAFSRGALWLRLFPTLPGFPHTFSVGSFWPESIAFDMRPFSSTIVAGTQDGRIMRARDANSTTQSWLPDPGFSTRNDGVVGLAYAGLISPTLYAITRSGRTFVKADVDSDSAWVERGRWMASGPVRIGTLCVNPGNPRRLYAASDRQVARSRDGGATWQLISAPAYTVPPDAAIPINRAPVARPLPDARICSVATHPTDPALLFAGLENGGHVSRSDGRDWERFYDATLPNAVVNQVFVWGGFLYATTAGRGLWRRAL